MAHLKTIGGNFHGRCYEITDALTIGRGINADIQVLMPGISRSHTKIIFEDDKYFAIDLGSKNGTRVNNKLIQKTLLQSGDLIELGKVKYTFSDPASLQVSSAKGSGILNILSGSEDPDHIGGTSAFFKFDQLDKITKHELIQKLNVIISIAQDISSSLNIDTLLVKLIDRIIGVFPTTDSCTIILRDDKGNYIPLHRRYATDQKIPFHDILISQAILQKEGAIRNISVKIATESHKQSLLISPIIYRDELLGLIQLQSKLDTTYFIEEDLAMMMAISVQVSAAIATARMHADILQQQSFQQDLEIAQRVQLNFLPNKDPSIRGFQFSSCYFPALQVGGDFYNYIYKKNEIFIAIGDVSGKGIPAALVMAKLTSEIKFFATLNNSPGLAFNEVNQIFEKECSNDFFATALLLKIDIVTGRVLMANAGHHPPIIKRENGKIEEIQGGDTPLGTVSGILYEDIPFQLNKGDMLILYTDGITESTNRHKKEFGLDGLMASIETVQSTPRDLLQEILKSMKDHRKGAKQKDDMTVICISRDLQEIDITKAVLSSKKNKDKDEDTDLMRIDQPGDHFDILNEVQEDTAAEEK
jgi:serine phosphatase RsbU (regulator of sigma subunit)